jgi:hypothetical protein
MTSKNLLRQHDLGMSHGGVGHVTLGEVEVDIIVAVYHLEF